MNLALVLVVAGFIFDRLMLKVEERGWIYWRRRKASPGTAASATLEVQQLLEPSKKHVLEVQREEKAEQDEKGDSPTAGLAAKEEEPGGRRS